MTTDPLILAFDTSAAHCAAALLSGDRVLATRSEPMTKGQAEALFPMLENVLNISGKSWADITRIGVGIGPGNFTGIRIAISAARGLALSLNCPAIGVSTFAAIHHGHPKANATVRAPRDMAYLLKAGESTPALLPLDKIDDPQFAPDPDIWATTIARIAAKTDPETAPLPAPIYLRPADAAPSSDTPPVIIP